jgi:hypothetical protein
MSYESIPHPIYLRIDLILSYHVLLHLRSGYFVSYFPDKDLVDLYVFLISPTSLIYLDLKRKFNFSKVNLNLAKISKPKP